MAKQHLPVVSSQDINGVTKLTVLRVASDARNSVTELYSRRPSIAEVQIEDLVKKFERKLQLNRIDASVAISHEFVDDRIATFASFEDFKRSDLSIESLTQTVVLKWTFVFDPIGDGDSHLHNVLVRISESPAPGLVLQKMLSASAEERDVSRGDFYSPIVCKLDFNDSRFSKEMLSVVSEWVKALPKAEPVFTTVEWLNDHIDTINRWIAGTGPTIAALAYVGIWLAWLPDTFTGSLKYAAAFIVGAGAVYLLSRFFVALVCRAFERHLRRICAVPIFQLTSGDKNRVTKYLSKSKRSLYSLAATGFVYGVFKAIGLYLGALILTSLW